MLNLSNNDIEHISAGLDSLKEGINTALELNDFDGQRESKEIAKRTTNYLGRLKERVEGELGKPRIGLVPIENICGSSLPKLQVLGICAKGLIHIGYLEFTIENGVFLRDLEKNPQHEVTLVMLKRHLGLLPFISRLSKF
jgi:hypothetical protein